MNRLAKWRPLMVSLAGFLTMQCPLAAQDEKQNEPLLVGPGTVSTSVREFATSVSPDESTLYFNRAGNAGNWQIWASRVAGSAYQPPEELWFSDDRYDDVDPFISRTGDRLYFSSDRPLPGSDSTEPTPDMNTWYAPWGDGQWAEPVYAGAAVNTEASETFVSESAAGELVFARFGEGSGRARPAYLMMAPRAGEGFVAARQIETSPLGLRLTNPAISPDGKLIVASGTSSGAPTVRLYASRRSGSDIWSPFKPLAAPVNLPGVRSFAPYIANDGKTLFFASDRPSTRGGSDDIYRIALSDALGADH